MTTPSNEAHEAAAALRAEAGHWPDLPNESLCVYVRLFLTTRADEDGRPHVAAALREVADGMPSTGTIAWSQVRKDLLDLADEIAEAGL